MAFGLFNGSPLSLHPRVYDPNEPDPRDPFFDIPRGGQPVADSNFYLRDPLRVNSLSGFRYPVLIRGLNFTIRQLWAADTMLKEECFELGIYSLLDITDPRAKTKLWGIKTKMLAQFPFLRSVFDCEVNGWWAHDAFHGWILSSLNWIKQHSELLTDPLAKLHTIPRGFNFPRPQGFAAPAANQKYGLKHCFLKFTLPHNSIKYVPFTVIMKLQSAGDSELYLGTTDISILLRAPTTEFGVCDPATHIIKYTKQSTLGFSEDVTVETSKELRVAIMDLWEDGQRVFDMSVVCSIVDSTGTCPMLINTQEELANPMISLWQLIQPKAFEQKPGGEQAAGLSPKPKSRKRQLEEIKEEDELPCVPVKKARKDKKKQAVEGKAETTSVAKK